MLRSVDSRPVLIHLTKASTMPTTPRKSKSKPWTLSAASVDNNSQSLHSNYELYNSSRWRNYASDLRALFPLCLECIKVKKLNLTDVIDHVIPINHGGSASDIRNHRPLCSVHHNSKRGKEAHGAVEAWVYNKSGEKIPEANQYKNKRKMLLEYDTLKKNVTA